MSVIRFCTDFHLGKKLREHTTAASQKAMQDYLYTLAKDIVEDLPDDYSSVVNLGDLFDLYSNPEHIVLQGIDIASQCEAVLQGNHDVRNLRGSCSSLDVVGAALSGNQTVISGPGTACVEVRFINGVMLVFVPHHFTQAEFAKAIAHACEKVEGVKTPKRVLCLHCNVNDGIGHEVDPEGSSLHLTSELQKMVAEHFPLTLVGHEHISRTIHPLGRGKAGRIVILGNHFPMGFGEIADRYVWDLNTDTMELDQVLVFDAEKQHATVEFDPGAPAPTLDKWVRFATLDGKIDVERKGDLDRYRVEMWKKNPNLFALRNQVEITGARKASRAKGGESMLDLIKRSAKEAGVDSKLDLLIQEILG